MRDSLGGGSHLREIWNFVQRNRLLTFGVPLVMVIATAIFVWNTRSVYDATVWLRIEEERSNLPVLDALKDISSGSQVATEMQVLRRRPLAEAVIDRLALQLALERPRNLSRSEVFDQVRVSRGAPEAEYTIQRIDGTRFVIESGGERLVEARPGERVEIPGAEFVLLPAALEYSEIEFVVHDFHELLRDFREALEVSRPDREADIVVVRYQGVDRELVRDVPNTLAEIFIGERQSLKRGQASGTVTFLQGRLAALEEELREAEEAVKHFREREGVISLEYEGEAAIDRMGQLLAERDLLDAEREALARLLTEVLTESEARGISPEDPSPYRRLMGFPSLLANFAVSELFRSLAEVENERAALLNRRTEEDPDVQVLTDRISDLEAQLRFLTVTYLEGLTNQVNSLNEVLEEFRSELGSVPAREVEFARLQRRAEVLHEIYMLLQTRLQETQIVAAVDDQSIYVVEPAAYPLKPIKPRKKLSLVLALLLGALLGGGIAFIRENMDDTIQTREDLAELADDLPVLGLIPRIRVVTRGEEAVVGVSAPALESHLIAGRDPRNPVSEAYRSLRTNISFSRMGAAPRSIVFTSPTPGDGKSTSAANLAITVAQQGLRTLLIDADMRRGYLNDALGRRREPGLSNLILGRTTLESAVTRVDLGESGTLDFLPTGTIPPNPAELLGSEEMQAILRELGEAYELIVLDAPPLTLVTDAAILGSYADGVILVARSGTTERGAIRYALDQLRAVRAPVLGLVLNDIDQRKEQYYGSYSAGAHASYYGTVLEG